LKNRRNCRGRVQTGAQRREIFAGSAGSNVLAAERFGKIQNCVGCHSAVAVP
jgi:hypothetical protein